MLLPFHLTPAQHAPGAPPAINRLGRRPAGTPDPRQPMSREKPAASARRDRKKAFMAALDERSERYGRQAEALITTLEPEYGDSHEGADIGELCDRPLSRGVLRHLRQIFEHADFLDPRTVRRFYVELRMWGDMLAAEKGEEPRIEDIGGGE